MEIAPGVVDASAVALSSPHVIPDVVESDAPVFHWDPDEDDEFDALARSDVDRERFGRNVWARVGDSHRIEPQDGHELPIEGDRKRSWPTLAKPTLAKPIWPIF